MSELDVFAKFRLYKLTLSNSRRVNSVQKDLSEQFGNKRAFKQITLYDFVNYSI